MNRLIFSGALLCVLFLIVGTFAFPTSMIMELASLSFLATIFRFLMLAMLLTVLFTSPPREVAVRVAMGTMAFVLIGLGLGLSFGSSMHVLDLVIYLAVGCSLGIEALEFNDDEQEERVKQYHEAYSANRAAAKV